jgi:hypothetical protein
MNHYREQLELHIYTETEALWEAEDSFDVIVLSDDPGTPAARSHTVPVIYLYDAEVDVEKLQEGGVIFVDKYQEVNKIVDEILKQIGEEIRNVRQSGSVLGRQQLLAVYALSENEYQLPFAVTLASILSEKERVLLLDLQENSGLSQMVECTGGAGIEELLVMAESGKYSKSRIVSCIGHLDRTDIVYPASNTECLCEVQNGTYQKLFRLLEQEMDYSTVVLNMGSRFVGFFDLLESCSEVYLLKSRGGLGQWREKEFFSELEMRGNERLQDRLREIPIPLVATPMVSCERLVEQWKWNELGDSIRRMMPEVMSVG